MKFMIRNLLVNMIINRRKHKTRSSPSLRECFFRCSCRKISAFILHINKPSSFQNYPKVTKDGFTLVELISVVAIIAILAAIAIPSYGSYIIKVRIARTVTEIRMLEQAISLYKSEKDRLPDTLTDIGYAGLLDPWGHPYQYLNIADGGVEGKGKLRRDRFLNPLNSDFDLYSVGIDGDSKTNLNAKESQDDVVRVLNGGFIGLASDF